MTAVSRRTDLIRAIIGAVIYARVSKDEAGGRSCREQVSSSKRDCEYEGWPVLAVLVDNDRGASRHSRREREDFKKLPDVLQPGMVLVLWEPSRITRNMAEFAPFCDMLAERGVLLYYEGHTYDMRDDDDRNRVWQDILDGAKAAGKHRKRVMRALNANLDELKPHGRLAPGYQITRDRSGKSTGRVIIPEQARLLREGARHLLDEEDPWTWYRFRKWFEPRWREVGGGGQMDINDLQRIYTTEFLFGWRVSGEKIVGTGKWEAILDPEWYPRLKRKAAIKAYRGKPRSNKSSAPCWWLSYIARCQLCLDIGEPGLISHRTVPDTCSGHAYYCRENGHLQRDMGKVDRYVTELLMRLLEDPDTLRKLTARDTTGRVTIEMELEAIAQWQREISEYVAAARKTRMSASSVAAYIVPLEDDIRAAQARVEDMTIPIDPTVKGAFGPNARERWFGTDDMPGYTLEDRRRIVAAVMDIRLVRVARRGRHSDVGVETHAIGAPGS